MNKNYEYTEVLLAELIPYINNSRTHPEEQVKQIAASIKEFGFTAPVLVDEEYGIIAGHGRCLAAQKLGLEKIPCVMLAGLTDAQKKAYVIADNQLTLNSEWDLDILKLEVENLKEMEFDIELLGFDDDFLNKLFKEESYADGVAGSMSENFGQPPFSILDTRKGDWLERKRHWRELIGDEGESRENILSLSAVSDLNNGVSILDPVMAELMVAWFGGQGLSVYDPFAGDTVFGFVAGTMGMTFHGIELRKEQADLNQFRCTDAGLDCTYYNDTSENADKYLKDESVDMIFTCPPYADLEVYSDDPNDLSTMGHDDFFVVYSNILTNTFNKLKTNRFAVVVMGEVRGKHGAYIGTIPKTIGIMEAAGYQFYNEIILVNSAGTLPLRAGKSMRATRKVGKMHQNILIFLKGDAKKAVAALGDIRMDLEGDADEQ